MTIVNKHHKQLPYPKGQTLENVLITLAKRAIVDGAPALISCRALACDFGVTTDSLEQAMSVAGLTTRLIEGQARKRPVKAADMAPEELRARKAAKRKRRPMANDEAAWSYLRCNHPNYDKARRVVASVPLPDRYVLSV